MNVSSERPIVITSNEPWGDIWFSKQHYANELSKLGHDVYFINPPNPWKLKNIFSRGLKSKRIHGGLQVIDIQNTFPVRLLPSLFLKINDWLNCRALARVIRQKKIIFWHFDPFRFVHISHFQARRIYHVVDPYFHIFTDKILSKKSDLIVLVSSYYKNHYPVDKSLIIPHGLSHDETKLDDTKLTHVRNEVGKDYVIFVGTINPDVDLKLIKGLCDHKIKIVVIGNTPENEESIRSIESPYLRCLGTRSAKALKYYIQLAKACIIPYKNKLTGNIHRTPLKLVNYLAQAKPVVTTINYELKKFDELYVFYRKDQEFIDKVKELVNESHSFDKLEINNYLDEIRYSSLIRKILQKLPEHAKR